MKAGLRIVDQPIDWNLLSTLGQPIGIENEMFLFFQEAELLCQTVPVQFIQPEDLRHLLNDAAYYRLTYGLFEKGNIPKRIGAIEVSKPSDVPRLRTYLLDMWYPDSVFEKLENTSVERSDVATTIGPRRPAWQAESGILKQATLWWVGAEMVDLLQATIPTVPPDIRTSELPIPSAHGLIVFEKPWFGTDAITAGHAVHVNAMSWGETILVPPISRPEELHVIAASCYRKIDYTNQDDFSFALSCQMVQEGIISQADIDAKQILGRMTGHGYAFMGRSNWPHADELIQSPFAELSDASAESWIEDRRVLAAFWNLIAQEKLTERTITYPARPVRRDAERRGVDKEASGVTVVDIRKRAPQPQGEQTEGSGDSRYSHRWWVDPFWRRQPVGPGRKERRWTLVVGHLRGPGDKPFVPKEKVRAWR